MNALNLELMMEDNNSPMANRKSTATDESIVCLQVMVAGWQPLPCWISSKARISELKGQLKEMLGLCYANEFEIFELTDQNLKMLYEEEIILRLKC